jgi:hypothetical protein
LQFIRPYWQGFVIWTILVINLLTTVISFKKRMVLYSLLNVVLALLVTCQALLIRSDLERSYTANYLFNYINGVGFDSALLYVFGISSVLLLFALFSSGYRRTSRPGLALSFVPDRAFYVSLFTLLCIFSAVLIFVVVGLSEFLNSTRPGFQHGATIFLVLLYLGLLPLLFKIIYKGRIGFGDLACFAVSFFVTGATGRLSAMFYMVIILLALYHTRGWADRPITPRMVGVFLLFGIAALVLFIAYGAIRGAQAFTSGSLSDLIAYGMEHPEKSVLSLEFNYRFDIEGMSGVAGAFTQYLAKPNDVQHDYGAAWILTSMNQLLPSSLKPYASALNNLGWYPFSIIPTGVETFFTSFGWSAIILYPVCVYLLAWKFPLKFQRAHRSPFGTLVGYVVMAWAMLFVRGPLTVWIAFSFVYPAVAFFFWPMFARQFKATGAAHADSE